MLNEIWHLPVVSRGNIDVIRSIRFNLIDSQEGDGFEQGLIVLACVLADQQVSDDQNGTLTEDVVFSLIVGDTESFRRNNGFEFSVFVESDLVVSTVGQELSESSLFSVVTFHLLSGIVVGEGSIEESKVSKTDQESRGDDVFSISSIINESILFFQSVSWFDNNVERNSVDSKGDIVEMSIEDNSDSVKVELRVGRFSSNQRNSVQEGSIFGDEFSISSVFVKDLRNTRGVRESHVSGFSGT